MYPNLYAFFDEVFGVELGALRFINTFGFFVAVAFFIAFFIVKAEIKWRSSKGLIKSVIIKRRIGDKPKLLHLGLYGILGLVFGYKIIGIIGGASKYQNSQEYLTSTDGSIIGGILIATLFVYTYYKTKKKEQLPKPEVREVDTPPHHLMDQFLLISLIAGFVGAKIFHNLENIDDLINDPINSVFGFSGLTFYGGIIFAIIALYHYMRKVGLRILPCFDSLGITVMFAYGIGRLGCHFAGDGDWGIYNTSPNPFFIIPDWLWAYDYPNNVLGIDLAQPVYPTPLYEAIICISMGFLLRWIGRRFSTAGLVTALYFILAGAERLLIEQIRVNNQYTLGSLKFTQAELISICAIILGIAMLAIGIYNKRTSSPLDQ